jgi:hypothetical protein
VSNLHFKALSALRVGTCADLINLNDAANELWRVGVAQSRISLIYFILPKVKQVSIGNHVPKPFLLF